MISEGEPASAGVMKVRELTPRSRRVNLTVKVVSKGDVREVSSSRDQSEHRVSEALVGDETGCLYLTLWDSDIERVNEGDTISIHNGYVNLFRGSMRLNIGRYGSFETLEESPIEEVNEENNLSNKRYSFSRRPFGYGSRRMRRY